MPQFLRARDVVDVADNLKRIPLVNDPFHDISSDIIEVDSNENDNVDWLTNSHQQASRGTYNIIRDNISDRIIAISKIKDSDEEINNDL